MSETTRPGFDAASRFRARLESELHRRGFLPEESSPAFRSKLFQLEVGPWMSVTDLRPALGDDPLVDPLGRPGLWRPVANNGSFVNGFQLPLLPGPTAAGMEGDDLYGMDGVDPDSADELEFTLRVLDWARATADGALAKGWESPSREEIEAWLPEKALTVQRGEFFVEGQLIREPGRLALVFDELGSPVDELPASRQSWVRATLIGALRSWRLVRVGLSSKGRVQVEIDLSGAPRDLLGSLIVRALPGLRWVVQWLLPPISFLTDPRNECASLDADPTSVRRSNVS